MYRKIRIIWDNRRENGFNKIYGNGDINWRIFNDNG